jgi:hypothetical protein
MLKTLLCDRLGIDVPLVLTPMGPWWRRITLLQYGGTEHDIASRYAGCAWRDSTEHPLNDAVATWSHASSLVT